MLERSLAVEASATALSDPMLNLRRALQDRVRTHEPHVRDLAAELGIKITEADITRHDVFIADECFLTGTAAEIIPVIKADGRLIGNGKPGPISARMIARFRQLTRETGRPIYN